MTSRMAVAMLRNLLGGLAHTMEKLRDGVYDVTVPSIERSEIGKGLNPQAPDLADAVPAWSPRQLFWIVKNGLKMTGMPSFGKTHDDNQVWNIVAFIEQLPGMSYEQYQEMKQQAGRARPTVSAMPTGRR